MSEFICGGVEALQALCKARRQWGMMLSVHAQHGQEWNPFEEARKAAPYLSEEQAQQLVHTETVYLLFASERDCYDAYWRTVGDDGPTHLNAYDGPVRVYALTCTPDGATQNENT